LALQPDPDDGAAGHLGPGLVRGRDLLRRRPERDRDHRLPARLLVRQPGLDPRVPRADRDLRVADGQARRELRHRHRRHRRLRGGAALMTSIQTWTLVFVVLTFGVYIYVAYASR